MKRRVLIIFLFCVTPLILHAQQWAFELWHDGKIVLESRDTLKGLVKYDLQQDLIQYNSQRGSIEAFTARKVLFFEIFDKTVGLYRQFFSIPYSATGGYRTPVFFELLEEGKMTLLTREALEYRTSSSPYYLGSTSRVVMTYKYYMLNDAGIITEFIGKKSDLLKLMGKYAGSVEDYMRENKLDVEDRNDIVKIIAYYNSFFKT
jgi:hypothetical protein